MLSEDKSVSQREASLKSLDELLKNGLISDALNLIKELFRNTQPILYDTIIKFFETQINNMEQENPASREQIISGLKIFFKYRKTRDLWKIPCLFSTIFIYSLLFIAILYSLLIPKAKPENVPIENWNFVLISFIILFTFFFIVCIWFYLKYNVPNSKQNLNNNEKIQQYSSKLFKRLFFFGLIITCIGVSILMFYRYSNSEYSEDIAFTSPSGLILTSITMTGVLLLGLACSYWNMLESSEYIKKQIKNSKEIKDE